MHRVHQTILAAPHGNALQACVASIIGLPLEEVPNFVVADDYFQAMLAHANSRGLSLLKIPLSGGKLPFASLPGTVCVARGESPRGAHGHVIVAAVAQDGVTLDPAFDPHPSGGYLAGPAAWACFYVAREPALLPPPAPAGCTPSHTALAEELAAAGFDVLAPLRVSWYNDYLVKLGLSTDSTAYLEASGESHASGEAKPFALAPLPDFGRHGNALAFLVGNSKALWPHFLRWLAQQPEGAGTPDPVDVYSAKVIGAAFGRFASSAASGASAAAVAAAAVPFDTFWASDMSPARLVDMNRAARVSGLCAFSDELFLSVHPAFGSWVAFRAVVVLDLPATHLHAPPLHLPPLLSDAETEAARAAFAEALRASSEVELSVDGMPLHLAHKWAKMRDCVGVGREHKYSDVQSEYHYTKDKALLS